MDDHRKEHSINPLLLTSINRDLTLPKRNNPLMRMKMTGGQRGDSRDNWRIKYYFASNESYFLSFEGDWRINQMRAIIGLQTQLFSNDRT